MEPERISITNYTYNLPPELIAAYPIAERENSKLLIFKNLQISEDRYKNISNYLPESSLLVFNNTKVVKARMFFKNETGATIEIFCLEPPLGHDISTAMATKGSIHWKCLVGKAAKWKEKTLRLSNESISLEATMVSKIKDAYEINFSWKPEHLCFAEVLQLAGVMPIPPYLKRATEQVDQDRYQTVYAKEEGSVAAPTAGLHFTDAIFNSLKEKQCTIEYVTLHVGAGTFKPVKAPNMAEHEMHSEFIDVSSTLIENILNSHYSSLIAVGTTSLRTLESLYWLGVKVLKDSSIPHDKLELLQWEPYQLTSSPIDTSVALEALLNWMKQHNQERLICKTSLLIVPGYQIRMANALVTNFHQPESTLILLVAAAIGEDWRKVYDYALENKFRFLSYGDGSLLFTNKK